MGSAARAPNTAAPLASPAAADLRGLLEAQRAAFARHPPGYGDRIAALRALESAIVARQDDIAAAISDDFGGRPAEETLALELFPLLNEIRHARRNLKSWMTARPARIEWQFWPARGRILHQPLGVVGVLSPWNYPVYLALTPLAGILAAGNHALLKPSELAPATAGIIQSIVSGLYPPEYVSVVTGGAETGAEFSRLPLDHLLFTGSPRVGRLVMRAASENLVPVTLELGGKCPAIVHPDYPIAKAATRIVIAKLFNAGQTCIAPDYALVPAGRRDEFVKAAQAVAARMLPSLVNNPDYTRIINVHHYRRLAALVDDARRHGAEVIEVNAAGEACDETNRVFTPTIVASTRDDMAIMQEEIFGPVLPIVEYRGVAEAVAYVNARPHPLAVYYFDEDERRAEDLVSRVTAGGATVNDCLFHVGQAALPFGGVGPSGMGRYHGFAGFETFSHRKGVFVQPRWAPLRLVHPPYGARLNRVLRFLLRRG